VTGLTKIGGLLAILKISMILSYIHEKIYEKQMKKQIKKAADRHDIQIEEIKKTITIENYFLLAQEH
jgi:uncharacterized membrane protein